MNDIQRYGWPEFENPEAMWLVDDPNGEYITYADAKAWAESEYERGLTDQKWAETAYDQGWEHGEYHGYNEGMRQGQRDALAATTRAGRIEALRELDRRIDTWNQHGEGENP